MPNMQRAKSESNINRRGLRRTQSQGAIRRKHSDAPKKKRDPVLVRRKILEGPWWQRFARRFVKDEIEVECLGDSSVASSAFYSADLPDATEFFSETQPVFQKPTKEVDNLVYRGDPYEIRVIGMQVAKWDRLIPSITGNEIVMYSEEKDQGNSHNILPYIHYDFQRDGRRESTKADEYIPIPSTKSYVAGFKGSHKSKHPIKVKPKKNVDFRFRLLEIDSPDGSVRNAIDGLEGVDEVLTGFSSSVPFLGLLSPALGMSSVLTMRALEAFSKPDFIMSVDMSFLIADRRRVESNTAQAGNYLRYGYYYFLSEPTTAKLYASVKTPQHVQLMLHQDPEYLERMKKKRKKWDPVADRPYFPLVDTNYIVVRVTEPTGISKGRHKYTFLQDAGKLQNIFNNARNEDVAPGVTRNELITLGSELGIFDSDSEDLCMCPKCVEKRYGRKYPWDNPLDPEMVPMQPGPSSKLRKAKDHARNERPYTERANMSGPSSSQGTKCTEGPSDESDFGTPALETERSSGGTNVSQYGSSVNRPNERGSTNQGCSSDSEIGHDYASGPLPMRNPKNRDLGMSRSSLDNPVPHLAMSPAHSRRRSGRGRNRNKRRKNRANELHEFISRSKESSPCIATSRSRRLQQCSREGKYENEELSTEEEKIEEETNSYRKDDFVRMRRRTNRT